jgi:hypothetical protein
VAIKWSTKAICAEYVLGVRLMQQTLLTGEDDVRKIQIIDGSEYIGNNIRELIGKCGYLACFRHEDMGGNPVFSATVEINRGSPAKLFAYD